MIKILFLSAIVWLAVGVVFTIFSFIAFDAVLRKIFRDNRDKWMALGMPIGFFWVPKVPQSLISGSFSRGELFAEWKRHPGLTVDGLETQKIARLRTFSKIGKICFACGFIQMIISIGIVFLW